ncbi:NADP-dependent phosphogluconate dehydrogenase [Anaerorhabdus furcosa]|uniref:6-phosphogluconate dehydrogenase, decarboxylating n=1 Tax=Anaerorhabdus furcosa TaxID=118967 RepID=A0A1T4MM56_9FIRM|nr:NADP-dependent phosphogluconate dehydrogenase [Anaerorhabdus furcosa]SJZ68210.1 6-phosphogluconate dehydrogenase [Anaerorhabdus furcosa]
MKNDIGIFGLGVMGKSIALNISNHEYSISVYNREPELTKNFEDISSSKKVTCCYDIEQFVDSLEIPRKILLMVTAGEAVDKVIDTLIPYLSKGDIILDGGNSYFKDTIRRYDYLKNKGIDYLGVGISGGEQGALNGPSIMPSGDKLIYDKVKSVLEDIAAKADDGQPCCNYVGESGSGHYVKMVHNGIEYADIQIICEAYSFMKDGLKLTTEEIQKTFSDWNKGKLQSYLIKITSEILTKKDEFTDNYLIDMILDKAEQKGTGKWTAIEGFDLGTPIPTIVSAVEARYLSSKKDERMKASKILSMESIPQDYNKEEVLNALENAIYTAKICCYAQGFELLKDAAMLYHWNLDFGKIAMVWREGCIIRANFLNEIKEAFDSENDNNLILTKKFYGKIIQYYPDMRETLIKMIECGIYMPAFASALQYLDGYRAEITSANLLQAQRDYFGAHTYQRTDRQGTFHTIWE